MAAIDDLIEQIREQDDLKRRICREVSLLKQQKKFGLVFEEHLPEATPLIDVPIKKKSIVAEKDGSFNKFYRVKRIERETLVCETMDDKHEEVCFEKKKMISVAMFGEPIYPYLKPIDEIQNAPDSKLWHTLIEADNYHALQLLVYLYGGKVDCIYIDPPYNTGDKSWKYNNDYVDGSDAYRHSKWLNMMKKRLLLSKKLLNPQDSVLIVTIDEKEYLRLGCLLEELFPEARIQMVSVAIHSAGVSRQDFSRTDEYYFFVFLGEASPAAIPMGVEWNTGDVKRQSGVRWESLLRSGNNGRRQDRPNLYYPIYLDPQTMQIAGFGDPLPIDMPQSQFNPPRGLLPVFPQASDGAEACWRISAKKAKELQKIGAFDQGEYRGRNTSFKYLKPGELNKIKKGEYTIIGHKDNGAMILSADGYKPRWVPGTQWHVSTHEAGGSGGSTLLKSILCEKRFDFPKSLYAVHDAIRFFTAEKPNALIVDFFAGSGTTLHAVNLLNAEDGGNRRCIMVTNNEVSAEEEAKLKRQGFHPGDEEWDKLGIARYVNWPRTRCSIIGVDVNGNPLDGSYQTYLKKTVERPRTIKQVTLIAEPQTMTVSQKKELVALCFKGNLPQSLVKSGTKFIVSDEHIGSILFDENYSEEWLEELDGQDHVSEIYVVTKDDKEFTRLKGEVQELLGNIIEEEPVSRPMSDGFAANAKYFKLGFLDKNAVALNRQFKELLPMLWMKAGSEGECPTLDSDEIPDYMICENNSMAILTNDTAYSTFYNLLKDKKNIKTIYFVEDSEYTYSTMAQPFRWAKTYQLYRDYLDNFTINYER